MKLTRGGVSATVWSAAAERCVLSPGHRSLSLSLSLRPVSGVSRRDPSRALDGSGRTRNNMFYCSPAHRCFLRKLIDLFGAPRRRPPLRRDGGSDLGRNHRDGVSTVGVMNGYLTLFASASHRLPQPPVTEVVCLFVSFVVRRRRR